MDIKNGIENRLEAASEEILTGRRQGSKATKQTLILLKLVDIY